MTHYPIKILGITCLAVFLLAAPRLFAQDSLEDFGSLDDLSASESASETVSDNVVNETPADLGDGMVAESPSGADTGSSETGKMSEPDQVDALIGKYTFATENPKKDPFRPIVEKKVVLPPVRTVRPVAKTDAKPAAPAVKPIRLFISGIVGNEGQRLAVVKFENNEYTLTKDQIVEGKFKVVDILSDRVVVYSNKEQRRHTFKIGGDEKD
ncbi:MAG: hypothetical protein EOM80_02345 [Erysipelotrichia bacterium]|nr:hypothetical protein [Erysipelotrichia bacterium]